MYVYSLFVYPSIQYIYYLFKHFISNGSFAKKEVKP